MKEYKLSKEAYRKIKQMSPYNMETFINNIFQEGLNEGAKDNSNVTPESLIKAISSIKGIGGKRIAEIDSIIRQVFNERSGNGE